MGLLPSRTGLSQRAVELRKAGDADPFWRQFTAWPAANHSRNNHTSPHQSELERTTGEMGGDTGDNDWDVRLTCYWTDQSLFNISPTCVRLHEGASALMQILMLRIVNVTRDNQM